MIAPTTHGFNYKKKFDNIYPNLAKKYDLNLIPFLLEGDDYVNVDYTIAGA